MFRSTPMGSRAFVCALISAAVTTAFVPRTAAAEPGSADCTTPRRAVVTWLDNAHEHPDIAATCFDFESAGVRSTAAQARQVQKLLAVFDQRGFYVRPDSLPDDPDYSDAPRVAPVLRFPEVFVEKSGDTWRFPSSVVLQIPSLYDEAFSVDVESFVAELPQWTRDRILGGATQWWQVLGLLGAIFLGLLVRLLVSWVVGSWGGRIIRQAGQAADAGILTRAANPVGTLALGGVLSYALPLLRFSVRVNEIGTIAIRVLIAAAGVLLVYRLVDLGSDVFERRAAKTETKLDDQLIPLVRRALKVVVVAVGVIFVLQNMDVDVGSLLAGASLGGLAFTLAAKDTVANLFGSVSIFADRPFQVGDWVVINGHEGVVEEVGMRSTRIRTFYSSVISIPNSVVANSAVDNYGMRQYRRCMVTLGLTYDSTPDQVRAFVEGVRAILKANPKVRKDAYEVHFRDFGDSALEILLYFFFETDTWSDELAQRQNIFLEIMRLAREIGVSFAFPDSDAPRRDATQGERAPRKRGPQRRIPRGDRGQFWARRERRAAQPDSAHQRLPARRSGQGQRG